MKDHASKPEAAMSAPELSALAEESLVRQSYDDALRYLDLSLQREKTAATYRALGIVRSHMKDLDKAMEFFEEALALDETDAETLCAIGDAYCLVNDSTQAMGFYMLAIQMAPDVFKYKEKFSCLAQFATIHAQNEAAEKIIVNCLETPDLNCQGLSKMWYTGLFSHPCFQAILPSREGAISFDRQKFESLTDLGPFLDPYFVLGLRKLLVSHPVFEELLTALRQRLLNELDSANMAKDNLSPLAEALANYCFFTEYIFDTTADEEEKVKALRAHLEAAPDLKAERNSIAVYGCYAPLFFLKNQEKISQVFGADPLMKDLIECQIEEFDRLRKNAAALKAITPIENTVSGKVREQYEEFPYPRWKFLPLVSAMAEKCLHHQSQKKELQLLVAGCGTGSEAAWLALALPQAQILAVDLSRASLAYAESKAKKYKLKNIAFRQADILQLGSLGKKFDVITSGGVLHHMEDPVRGWQVLVDILKPGGMMRIGLYSEIARRNIVETIKIIKEKNYPSTAEGIRRFRREAPQVLPADVFLGVVTQFGDYFNMSMCRDLLFHVQEHRFTLPQLQKTLDQLGLTFREMSADGYLRKEYDGLYPDDPERINLAHWHEFEKSHPDAFKRMYQFWCQKAG